MSGHFIETDNFVIVVDKWDASYVRRAGNKPLYFFLTHLHADHIKGLTSTWSRIIYTSPFNAWLLPIRRSVRPELLRALDLDMTHTIQKPNDGTEFQVTVIDANHCPGSVMFLFQGSFGNILYTGDFRYHPTMLNNPSLAEVVAKKELNVMYIDNTYADPSCQFPSREEALQEVLNIIDEYPDFKFLIGLRQLGKEEVLRAIALHINERICVSPQRLQVLAKLEYEDVFTTDTSQSRIQAVELHTITQRHGQENTRQISIRLSSIYECTSSEKRIGNVYNVAYSDHSSHSELQQCVLDFRPHKLLPIVIPKVLDTTKYMGVWSRMSSVNCIIPESILSLCWPSTSKSQVDSVKPASPLQRTSPLIIKYHLTKDQQTMKHSDAGSVITPWDSQGPQLTVNNKARKHIKASWTRLAPKLLSQKGITFSESSSPTSDTGCEMENVCNGISTPQLPWRGVKRKRDVDPRSPLSAQNKTSESEGEDSVVEVPLSGDEDGILSIPSSAVELQLRLKDMKDSGLLKNGVKTNGVNSDKDTLKKQLPGKEICLDSSTNLESLDASCDSPEKKSENKNLVNGDVRNTSVISNVNTECGSTRRQSLARTVKQSPPEKTAATTVTRKPVMLEKKEKTKKLVKKSTSPKVVKMSEKETTNISPVGPISIAAEAKGKDANRVIKVTRRSAKEISVEDASIDIFTINSSQEPKMCERFSDKKEGEDVKLSAPLNNQQDEDSGSKEDLSLGNTVKISPSRRESVGVKLDSEPRSPTKKSSSPSTRAMTAWSSAEELARKQTERALKALEALNDMKGFKTRGGVSRTGGLKVANEVIALRRASGDSNPVVPSDCSGPKIRCRKASILSSMASTFEKDALKNPASVSESSPKPKQSSERRSPKAKSPVKSVAKEMSVTNDSKMVSDDKMKKDDSHAVTTSASKHEIRTDILPPEVDACQNPKPANDMKTIKSDQAMQMVEIIKRNDLARVKRSSLNVGLMRLKVDIAMNSSKRVRRSSLPANLSSLRDSVEMNRAAPKEKVQMWRSKISKLTQRRYKFKSPLKLRHSARLSLLKIPSKEQESSVIEDSNEDLDNQKTRGKHRTDSEETLIINEQDKYDNKSETQSCSGALESVHNDVQDLRRHSPRLSDSSSDSIFTRVLRKSRKLTEKSEANINGEEPQRRQSIRLSKEGSTEFNQPVNDRKSKEQPGKTTNKDDILTGEPAQSTKRQSLRLTQKGSSESKTLNANTNPKPNAAEETNSKRLSPRGQGKEERKMSSENSVGEKSVKKQQSLRKDSKTIKNVVNPDKTSSQLSTTDENSQKGKTTEVVDLTQNESHILSFGIDNVQNSVSIFGEMRKALSKESDTKVKERNIMKSVSENTSRLNNPFHSSKTVPSSLSIQLLPESLVSAASPTESGKSDWSIEIVPISNSIPDGSKGITSSSVGGFPKHRFKDLKTPDSLSIKLMSSTESNSRKEPSPPSLSISVASDDDDGDDVIVLSEESSRSSRPSLIQSIKHSGGQHKKLQSGSQWPPSKFGSSKYATPKLPQTGERNRLKKPAQSLIKPAPQAIWKENHNERTSSRSGENVVVVDIETEQDHCPVHCTCGQAARKREKSRQTQRDFDEDSDSSSLYEVPLSPEDLDASQAMVAFGEGWLDVCFDGEEDKREFLASYEPYLTKVVHEPRRSRLKVQQQLFKPVPIDQTATNTSTISPTIPSVVEEEPTPPVSKQQETDSKQPDAKSPGKEKSRKPSSDSGRSDSLLKEIEKKIRAYNEQQSKKRSRNSSDSSSTPDGTEPKKTRRRTEIEFLSETRQRTASKNRYRMSIRRSLDHLMTRQKLRSEKRLVVSSANHS